MKTWRQTFIAHLLRQRGLYYYGPDDSLEEELEKHHPHILREADRLTEVVEAKLAHDAVFKETPQS